LANSNLQGAGNWDQDGVRISFLSQRWQTENGPEKPTIRELLIQQFNRVRFPALAPEKRRKDGARNTRIYGPDQSRVRRRSNLLKRVGISSISSHDFAIVEKSVKLKKL
jgi:hypothetical protein